MWLWNPGINMDLLSIIQIAIFTAGTIVIFYTSKKSLLNFKVHGFYRFFVFEFTLVLIVINIPYWFFRPFSTLQIISWIFLTISLYPLIQSIYLFNKLGGVRKKEDRSANLNFENTTNLVKAGIYKYIRHPMYSSLLFLCLGTLFKNISVITILLAASIIIFLVLTAKVEEKENIIFFGHPYEDYMKKTRMFIPYIF
jgi:protein-S-isoprenylcysteine O-methyltransferase Ste14